MPRASRHPPFALAAGKTPMHRQVYEHFRAAITAGQLRPGDRLPSARALAQRLTVARGTIDAAYAMLSGEGYVISRASLGTVVSPELSGIVIRRAAEPRAAQVSRQPTQGAPGAFQIGLPALDAFPRKLWSSLCARQARALSATDMAYPDPSGYWPLREAIAAYFAVGRGTICSARQVVITNGYQGALDLIVSALLQKNEKIWFEDPCYPHVRSAFEVAGVELVPIPIDGEGMRVDVGLACAPRARLAVVTPSHQSPHGVALSLPRRLALLSWAAEARAVVIEDDGEFHYAGRPLPALKSLDRDSRVIYAGSLSKALYPGLRLGYLVLSDELVGRFEAIMEASSAGVPAFEQRVVTAFMAEGHFARHLKRMRNLYAARRRALAEALANVFGDRVAVDLQPGGMHLIARVADGQRDIELARKAREAGLAVESLSNRAIRHRAGKGLLLGFTNVVEAEALKLCRRLDLAIGKDLRSGGAAV
jgi:GntR family transcriptional regulator/MocR family aminotransferase